MSSNDKIVHDLLSNEEPPAYSRPYNGTSEAADSHAQLPSYGEATSSKHLPRTPSGTKDGIHAEFEYIGEFDGHRQGRAFDLLADNRMRSDPDLRLDPTEIDVLREYDTVIIVDDSSSMNLRVTTSSHETRWESVCCDVHVLNRGIDNVSRPNV